MEYYRELARRMRRRYLDSLGNEVLQKPEDVYSDCNQAATAINDLLGLAKLDADAQEYLKKKLAEYKDRAEAAEDRAEKAEKEKSEAIKWIREFTESIDQPCVACKHNTGDYVALGVCGGCSKENDKWEWDRGPKGE